MRTPASGRVRFFVLKSGQASYIDGFGQTVALDVRALAGPEPLSIDKTGRQFL